MVSSSQGISLKQQTPQGSCTMHILANLTSCTKEYAAVAVVWHCLLHASGHCCSITCCVACKSQQGSPLLTLVLVWLVFNTYRKRPRIRAHILARHMHTRASTVHSLLFLQVLNYGQSVFEGMKAQRSAKGNIVLFRYNWQMSRALNSEQQRHAACNAMT